MIEEIKKILKNMLSTDRYEHCIRTGEKAYELASIYSKNEKFREKAKLAATLHDIGKELDYSEMMRLTDGKYINILKNNYTKSIMHGFAGAEYIIENREHFSFLNEYLDEEFLNSIRYHTVGRLNMTLLDKIVYLSDGIEEARDYAGVEIIRDLAKIDLDKAILKELDLKINSLIERKLTIHINAIKLRNKLIKKGKYD